MEGGDDGEDEVPRGLLHAVVELGGEHEGELDECDEILQALEGAYADALQPEFRLHGSS